MAKYNFNTDFYVYIHCRASDGRVFYVGKGSGQRAWSVHGRSRHWQNVVKKHGLCVEIVQSCMQEWWAFELERDLIAFYGRDNLCNFTDGGDGASGAIRSESYKQHMVKNNPMNSLLNRKKISIALTGKKRQDLSEYPIMSRPGVKDKISGKNNKNSRRVICIENQMIFDTQTAAALWLKSIGFLKASNGDIAKCCKGKAKKSHGFHWQYA